MPYAYLYCPQCLRILAIGPRSPVGFIANDEWGDDGCWFCGYKGFLPLKRCGAEGKRATVSQRMAED